MAEKFVILDRFVENNLPYWLVAKINPDKSSFSGIGNPDNYITEKVSDDIILDMLRNSPIGEDYKYFRKPTEKIVNGKPNNYAGDLVIVPCKRELSLQTFQNLCNLKIRYVLISIDRVNNKVIVYDRVGRKFILDGTKSSAGSLMQLKRPSDSILVFKNLSDNSASNSNSTSKKPVKIPNLDNWWFNGLVFDKDHYLVLKRPSDKGAVDTSLHRYKANCELLSLIDRVSYQKLDEAITKYNNETSKFLSTYGDFNREPPSYGNYTDEDIDKALHPEKYKEEKIDGTISAGNKEKDKPINVLDAKVSDSNNIEKVADNNESEEDPEINKYYDSNGNCIDFDGLTAYLDKKRVEKLEKEKVKRKKAMRKPSIEVGISDAFRDVLDETEKRWVCISKNDLYTEMVFSMTERGTIDVPSSLIGYIPYKILRTLDGSSFEFREIGVDKNGVIQVEEVPITPKYVYLVELYSGSWKKYYLMQVNNDYKNRVKLQCLSDWVEKLDEIDLTSFTKKYVQWIGRKEFLRTSDWS